MFYDNFNFNKNIITSHIRLDKVNLNKFKKKYILTHNTDDECTAH